MIHNDLVNSDQQGRSRFGCDVHAFRMCRVSTTEQRTLRGAAIRVVRGAAIGAIIGGSPGVGVAVDAGSGAVGGCFYDQSKRR